MPLHTAETAEAAIDAFIRHTIKEHEKGFVNDPDDPGGPTNQGVSLRYARGIGLDLDKDGDTDIDDIRLVTPETAFALFKQDFYWSPGINKLPAPLQPQMFDISVHSGAARAIMILQQVLNKVREVSKDAPFDRLYVDGRMGPKTRKATEWAFGKMGPYLINAIAEERERFLYALAKDDPARFRKYVVTQKGGIGGWIKRARSYRVKVN